MRLLAEWQRTEGGEGIGGWPDPHGQDPELQWPSEPQIIWAAASRCFLPQGKHLLPALLVWKMTATWTPAAPPTGPDGDRREEELRNMVWLSEDTSRFCLVLLAGVFDAEKILTWLHLCVKSEECVYLKVLCSSVTCVFSSRQLF